MNDAIFGAQAHEANEYKKDYVLMQNVKPKRFTVEAVFSRINALCNLLEYFPPSFVKGD